MFTPKDKNIKTAALTHSHLFTKLKAHLALSHAKLHLLLQTPSLYFAKSTFSEVSYGAFFIASGSPGVRCQNAETLNLR